MFHILRRFVLFISPLVCSLHDGRCFGTSSPGSSTQSWEFESRRLTWSSAVPGSHVKRVRAEDMAATGGHCDVTVAGAEMLKTLKA